MADHEAIALTATLRHFELSQLSLNITDIELSLFSIDADADTPLLLR